MKFCQIPEKTGKILDFFVSEGDIGDGWLLQELYYAQIHVFFVQRELYHFENKVLYFLKHLHDMIIL